MPPAPIEAWWATAARLTLTRKLYHRTSCDATTNHRESTGQELLPRAVHSLFPFPGIARPPVGVERQVL